MARLQGALLFGVAFCALTACAHSGERPAALAVAARNLQQCTQPEMAILLNRETPKVREYLVGCNFTYTKSQS